MAELEENVLKELEIAQGAAMQGEEGVEGTEAAIMDELEKAEVSLGVGAATGCGWAKYALVDYFFTSGLRRLWVYIPDKGWKYRNINETQVMTIGKVVMEARRIYACWSGNQITYIRCWKHL